MICFKLTNGVYDLFWTYLAEFDSNYDQWWASDLGWLLVGPTHKNSLSTCSFICQGTVPPPEDSEGTFWSSSQAATYYYYYYQFNHSKVEVYR